MADKPRTQLRPSIARRGLLRMLAGMPLLAVGPALAQRTPSATEGPFYPTPAMRFADADNDLVKIIGRVREAGGEVVVLKGRILDAQGNPLSGARVEIWQCDAKGRYLHTGDRQRRQYDDAFQGYGHVITGPEGGYAFRTIKPVPYPGRTPHIHVKVLYESRELTTQFYLKDHPLNQRDGLYQRMSKTEQQAVSMTFVDSGSGPEATVEIFM